MGNIVLAVSTVGAYLCVELESEYAVLRTEILSSVIGRFLSAVALYMSTVTLGIFKLYV